MGKVFKFLVSLINMDVKKIEEQKKFIEENSLEVIAQGTATEFVLETIRYKEDKIPRHERAIDDFLILANRFDLYEPTILMVESLKEVEILYYEGGTKKGQKKIKKLRRLDKDELENIYESISSEFESGYEAMQKNIQKGFKPKIEHNDILYKLDEAIVHSGATCAFPHKINQIFSNMLNKYVEFKLNITNIQGI